MLEALEGRLVMSTLVRIDTTMGNIGLELDETKAPITVANFMNYLNAGRFNNNIVHRSQPGFVAQMGAYDFTITDTGTGAGEVGNVEVFKDVVGGVEVPRTIPREITGLSNTERTIAMARSSELASATSSFFFNLADNSFSLDPSSDATTTTLGTAKFPGYSGGYTVFGRVIYGWDVVQAIVALPRSNDVPGLPLNPGLGGVPIASTDYVEGVAPKFKDLVIGRSMATVDLSANRAVVGSGPGASYTVYFNPSTGQNEEYFFPAMVGIGNKPTAFVPPVGKDTWRAVDLTTKATPASPLSDDPIQTWADPNDTSSRAAVPTAQGLIVFLRNSLGGTWTSQNLTTSIPGALLITSEITVFKSADAAPVMHIAGLTADGQLVMYREVLQPLDPQTGRRPRSTWEFVNLSQDHLAVRGLETPNFTGRLISYVTSWNGLNIAGLDENGDIHSVWWAPGLTDRPELFTTSNLSAITKAPKFTGGLGVYLTSWGGINLAGIQTNGEVSVTWWVPAFTDGTWVNTNFTAEYGGPKLSADSLTSYVMNAWGGLNLVGINPANNKMTIYWWAPGKANPNVWDVTTIEDSPGYVSPVGRLAAATAPSGRTSIVGTAATGELMQYTWAPGEAVWTTVNITYNSIWSTQRA